MKEELDNTKALQRVLRAHVNHGYTLWISFQTDLEKVEAKDRQWAEQYGTRLPSWKRQDQRQRGIPTATATSVRVLGEPNKRELILMATPFALTADARSAWAKESWKDRLPECGPYVMVHEPRHRGDYAWTWRLQQSQFELMSRHLTRLVKSGDATAVRMETQMWLKVFSLQGGVRRQIKRLLSSGQKLWTACHRTPWPGVGSEELPMIVGYR